MVQPNSFWIEFLHNTYFRINAVMFKVVSLGLYTASPADAKLFKAFNEGDSLKQSKCIL
jgi:hypothetical protein